MAGVMIAPNDTTWPSIDPEDAALDTSYSSIGIPTADMLADEIVAAVTFETVELDAAVKRIDALEAQMEQFDLDHALQTIVNKRVGLDIVSSEGEGESSTSEEEVEEGAKPSSSVFLTELHSTSKAERVEDKGSAAKPAESKKEVDPGTASGIVSLCSYPGFNPDRVEPFPLPAGRTPADIVANVCTHMQFSPAMGRARWTELFGHPLSIAIMQDTFWYYWCAIYMRRNAPGDDERRRALDGMFTRIATNYYNLFQVVEKGTKDDFFGRYADMVAQAVFHAFCVAFPHTVYAFDNAFKAGLANMLSHWMNGQDAPLEGWRRWPTHLRPVVKDRVQAANESAKMVMDATMKELSILGVELFDGIHDDRFFHQLVRALIVRTYHSGDDVATADSADEMYFVSQGSCRLARDGYDAEVIKPGGSFGELALVIAGSRAWTAVAMERTELFVLTRKAFQRVMDASASSIGNTIHSNAHQKVASDLARAEADLASADEDWRARAQVRVDVARAALASLESRDHRNMRPKGNWSAYEPAARRLAVPMFPNIAQATPTPSRGSSALDSSERSIGPPTGRRRPAGVNPLNLAGIREGVKPESPRSERPASSARSMKARRKTRRPATHRPYSSTSRMEEEVAKKEFTQRPFNLSGRSPLIAHYLSLRGRGLGAGKDVHVRRTEIPTHREGRAAVRQKVQECETPRMAALEEYNNSRLTARRELRRLHADLREDLKVIKQFKASIERGATQAERNHKVKKYVDAHIINLLPELTMSWVEEVEGTATKFELHPARPLLEAPAVRGEEWTRGDGGLLEAGPSGCHLCEKERTGPSYQK